MALTVGIDAWGASCSDRNEPNLRNLLVFHKAALIATQCPVFISVLKAFLHLIFMDSESIDRRVVLDDTSI
jgi:hypothetical protein